MKRINSLLLHVLSIFLLISCSGKKDDSSTLKLGVMSSMDYLPLAVAQREGYFDKVGLNIHIQKFYSANERDAAFQSNSVDGVVIDYTGAILQKAGGIDLKLVSKCDAPFYIVAGSQSGIDSLSQLKGRKVAVSQNTVIDYCVDMALKATVLAPNEIEKVEINKIPVRFEMLVNNKIDATGLPNPFALMAEDSNCKILTSNNELGFAITGIIFSGKAIDSKTEMINKMYEAYNLGVEYLKSHTTSDIEDILIDEFGFPGNIISKTILPEYSKAEIPSDKDIEFVTNWLVERKLIDSSFEKNTLLDSQFIK